MTPLERFNEIKPLIKMADDDELMTLARFLYSRIKNPESYVIFLGETSSGKSSLINGMLQSELLTVKPYPTTGSITEIELCDTESTEYSLIYKNATVKPINHDEFCRQTVAPDKDIHRVKVRMKGFEDGTLRLFDTPGYGSIIDEHEEILKEFLPNSDVLVYTVSYRVGIKENDYAFLSCARDLIRDDVKIMLAINLCPADVKENDRRVAEIQKYIESILHYLPETFLIRTESAKDEVSYPMPNATSLRKGIIDCVDSPKRKQIVQDALNDYIDELYERSSAIIAQKYTASKMTSEGRREFKEVQQKITNKLRKAIPRFIEPAFEMLKRRVPGQIRIAADNACKAVCADIDACSTADMEEMRNFVNIHSIPYALDKETSEVNRYVEIVLDDLNKKVNDYINETLVTFTNSINMPDFSGLDKSISDLINKLLTEAGTRGLGRYFAAFGGAGGSGAGIANAASHALKKIGNLFGHTFKRETHNALKHTLSKIGATSMRFVGASLTVVLELATVGIEFATWKNKLKEQVKIGINKWRENAESMYLKSLEELKKVNIDCIESIIHQRVESFDVDDISDDFAELEMQLAAANEIGRKIGVC